MTTNHISRHPVGRHIIEVRCKCCGTVIQGIVPSDHRHHITERKLKDGTRLREVLMVLMPNAQYRELEILCKDEAGVMHRHITHVCKTCLPKVSGDKEALTKMMQSDILDQIESEHLDLIVGKFLLAREVQGVI